MSLTMLSGSYLSDAIDDSGARTDAVRRAPVGHASPLYFWALCRGIAVLFALGLPIGLTILGMPAPMDTELATPGPSAPLKAPIGY